MAKKRSRRRFLASVEAFEERALLSTFSFLPNGLTPTQIDSAYRISNVNMGVQRGAGQEIAIVVVGDDPHLQQDLDAFDAAFGIPNTTLSITRLGVIPTDVGNSATPGNALETMLDVEQAHQIAPGAKIDVVEVPTSGFADVFGGMRWAALNLPVSVVSSSWAFVGPESAALEATYDSYFVQPMNRNVVYFTPSGDMGTANTAYPSFSPNVIGVGGTVLSMSGNTYLNETIWGSSGGAVSAFEPQPAFQHGVVDSFSTTHRVSADVSFNAGTPEAVYDSWDGGISSPWTGVVGTSIGAPSWAAITAILDQGLAVQNLPTYSTQTLGNFLYSWYDTAAYHPVSGNRLYSPQVGMGSPVLDQLALDSTLSTGFSNSYYLNQNPDVAAAVAGGAFTSGYQHFQMFGLNEGRIATPDFYEQGYLAQNPDVAAAVRAGGFKSGYQHFILFGSHEGRSDTPFFNEQFYQRNNVDVADAIDTGAFSSGYQHFWLHGQREDNTAPVRDPSTDFDGVYYLAMNPDVNSAVASGAFQSGWQHFVLFGHNEGRLGHA